MVKRPLIIDCDPGTDDAQCIMMLAASGLFDIRGITATHGNVPLSWTAKNALFLSHHYGIDCPVYRGAEEAILTRLPRAEYVHGTNGLGSYEYSVDGLEYAEGKAWDFLYEQAVECKGELELIAIGPLTNIALTILKHPDFPKLIKKFVIMGGNRARGNATPLSEFNIYQDPHACEIVLQAGFEDFTMIDITCCHSAYLNEEEQIKLGSLPETNRIHGLEHQLVENHFTSVKNLREKLGENYASVQGNKMVFCDATAAAVLIDPSMGEYKDLYMFCETGGNRTAGHTVADWLGFAGKTNVRLTLGVDREKFAKLFFECVDKFNEV